MSSEAWTVRNGFGRKGSSLTPPWLSRRMAPDRRLRHLDHDGAVAAPVCRPVGRACPNPGHFKEIAGVAFRTRGLVKSAELPQIRAAGAARQAPGAVPDVGFLGNGVTVAQQTLTLFV